MTPYLQKKVLFPSLTASLMGFFHHSKRALKFLRKPENAQADVHWTWVKSWIKSNFSHEWELIHKNSSWVDSSKRFELSSTLLLRDVPRIERSLPLSFYQRSRRHALANGFHAHYNSGSYCKEDGWPCHLAPTFFRARFSTQHPIWKSLHTILKSQLKLTLIIHKLFLTGNGKAKLTLFQN